MDPRSFDALTRTFAAPKTRRGLLGAIAAIGAGLLGAKAADAQVTQAQCGNVVCYNRTTQTQTVACASGLRLLRLRQRQLPLPTAGELHRHRRLPDHDARANDHDDLGADHDHARAKHHDSGADAHHDHGGCQPPRRPKLPRRLPPPRRRPSPRLSSAAARAAAITSFVSQSRAPTRTSSRSAPPFATLRAASTRATGFAEAPTSAATSLGSCPSERSPSSRKEPNDREAPSRSAGRGFSSILKRRCVPEHHTAGRTSMH